MTTVLFWKEYRQQRAIWLAIALLSILLVVSLVATMGRGRLDQLAADKSLGDILWWLMLCLAVAYGVISGALTLAGEKEDGTLDFLDNQLGQRRPLWLHKAGASALLTLAQCLFLASVGIGFQFGTWELAILLPILGLNALAWGLLGGALCRNVLLAILTAIGGMALSWGFSPIFSLYGLLLVFEAWACLLALYCSRRIFCHDDFERQSELTPTAPRFSSRLFASERALLWLSLRQGRWLILGCLAATILLSLQTAFQSATSLPLVLWPAGTLLLGIVCGLLTFTNDQQAREFLGSQRFPLFLFWIGKVAFWGMILLTLMVLAYYLDTRLLALIFHQDVDQKHDADYLINKWTDRALDPGIASPLLLLGIWPLYGFCFGQFFGLLMRRSILAGILSVCVAALVLAAWVPSLIIGGVPVWQVVLIPFFALCTTLLAMRPWASSRLTMRQPIVGIIFSAVLMALSLAGSLWYRSVEVPDVGEPFDVKEFIASLPTPKENQAGNAYRRALTSMTEYRKEVERDLPPVPMEVLAAISPILPRISESEHYFHILSHVVEHGWPEHDQVIGMWLNRLFQGQWVTDARKAADSPSGTVLDYRLLHTSPSQLFTMAEQSRALAQLFVARALQLQAHGESKDALDHLKIVLALSRLLANKSPRILFQASSTTEHTARVGFRVWLEKEGPSKHLLRSSLKMWEAHAASMPDPAGNIKAQYLVDRDNGPHVSDRNVMSKVLSLAYLVPWERERWERVLNAAYYAQFQALREPFRIFRARHTEKSRYSHWAREVGLPATSGLGSNLDAEEWGKLIVQARLSYWPFLGSFYYEQRSLQVTILSVAVALYQAERGELPATLRELVPMYLPAIPIDPQTEKPFKYRVVDGKPDIG